MICIHCQEPIKGKGVLAKKDGKAERCCSYECAHKRLAGELSEQEQLWAEWAAALEAHGYGATS